MDEYNQLSDVDKHYVSAYGWDAFHKKKFLEKEFQRLNVPQSIPQPQEEKQLEETEESEEDDTDPDLKARMFESGIRDRKLRILAKIEARLDEEESAKEEASTPEAVQAEYKRRVDEAVKAVNLQLQTVQKQANEKIKAHVEYAFKLIDAHLINGKATDNFLQFVQIMALMEKDPLHNVEWVIHLYATKNNGIVMTFGNATNTKESENE